MESEIKEYEVGFLTREEQGKAAVRDLLLRHGGEIYFEGPFEKTPLAYPIKKESSAWFGYFHFKADSAEMPLIQKDLRDETAVLRSLLLTPPFAKREPRMMAPRPRMKGSVPTGPAPAEKRRPEGLPLSNEALEKKIEEILHE